METLFREIWDAVSWTVILSLCFQAIVITDGNMMIIYWLVVSILTSIAIIFHVIKFLTQKIKSV